MKNTYNKLLLTNIFVCMQIMLIAQIQNEYIMTGLAEPNGGPFGNIYGPKTSSEGTLALTNSAGTDFYYYGDQIIRVSAEFNNTLYSSDFSNTTSSTGDNNPDYGLNFGLTTTSGNLGHNTKVYSKEARMEALSSTYTTTSDYYRPTSNATATSPSILMEELEGFNMLTVTEGLNSDNAFTDDRYLMGTLTLTFDHPVDHPIIHVSGLGGRFIGTVPASQYSTIIQYSLWYTTELEATSHDLTVLSSTGVTNFDETTNTMYNDMDYTIGQSGTHGEESGTGSFRVEGENIDNIVFNVWMRGKPGQQDDGQYYTGHNRWSSYDGPNPGIDGPDFTDLQSYAGDKYHIAFTLPIYTFRGSVVIDDNQDGTTVETIDSTQGAEDELPTTLQAVLVNEEGKVVAIEDVDANGEFTFTGVLGDNYTVILIDSTDSTLTVGDDAPDASSLPTGWTNTEEGFSTTTNSSDGAADGVTNTQSVNYMNIADLETGTENLIFGISKPIILSVELLSFQATAKSMDAELTWKTASEENNSHFEVERSVDGKNWKKIGEVKGNGSTREEHLYSYTDVAIGKENSEAYYRLRQVDYDGTTAYTKVASVKFAQAEKTISIYPNPVRETISIDVLGYEDYKVEVYNVLGKKIASTTENKIAVADYQSGAYMVRVVDEEGNILSSEKVLVIK